MGWYTLPLLPTLKIRCLEMKLGTTCILSSFILAFYYFFAALSKKVHKIAGSPTRICYGSCIADFAEIGRGVAPFLPGSGVPPDQLFLVLLLLKVSATLLPNSSPLNSFLSGLPCLSLAVDSTEIGRLMLAMDCR